MAQRYAGRFAPSPTGPLHFGSLVAALASFLDARHNEGRWLLRIEDLDPPRESPAAPGEIMTQLKGLGLEWDGDVLYQSTRLEAYQAAFDQLAAGGHVYACTCTRKELSGVYNGKCRGNPPQIAQAHAIRLVVDEDEEIIDRILGTTHWRLGEDVGDFIIKRKDGLFAYQLAVVVDDAYQQITDVTRGADLLDSTPRQLALIHKLGLPAPRYAHIPVILGKDGSKLSKQTRARSVDSADPLPALKQALKALGQPIPPRSGRVSRLIDGAITGWDIDRVPRSMSLPLASLVDDPA